MDVRYRPGRPAPPQQNVDNETADDSIGLGKVDNPVPVGLGYCKRSDLRLNPTSGDVSVSPKQQNQSFFCFKEIPLRVNSGKVWNAPLKFIQIAARELSVLLILLETLILLGGYLMILGVHHSIRYCLSKIRRKSREAVASHNVPIRNYYPHARAGGVPRRVPRGRMAGG